MNAIVRIVAAFILVTTVAIESVKASSPVDSLVIRFANRTRLVIYAPDKAGIQALSNYDLNKIVREMGMKLDSVPGGETAISQDGERFLKDTVLVVTKKKDSITIVINDQGDTVRNETTQEAETKRDYERSRRRKRDNWRIDYGLTIGLNNFIQQSSLSAYPEDSYDLRPLGSRYVALSAAAIPTLIRGKYASLKLYYGVELAWNNFMFEGNNFIQKDPTMVTFPDAGRDLQKSKLTVCTIGIPVVPRITFYNNDGKRVGHFGVGGYANYRLDSYRKIKETDGGKDRRHSDYYLNDFRYGLMAHLGFRGLDLVVKYDLSPLFQENKGPDVRTLAFGIMF